MASGFFALLDDIAVLMDDVAVMGKVATKKTAGILGDDLAVNAEKAMGFVSSREIPVLWAITKGSFINKLIILPIAFLLSAFLPWIITPILLLGGVYLAYEGAEKIFHYLFMRKKHSKDLENIKEAVQLTKEEILAQEKAKIKSAIVTDFILSIEIIIIALGTVVGKNMMTQIIVVSFVALLATVGVYGIVALIIRMDDFGFKLIRKSKGEKGFLRSTGIALVSALPWVIKGLTVIGTIALLLVSGGIFTHSFEFLHHLFEKIPTLLGDLLTGTVVGMIALPLYSLFSKLFKKKSKAH